MKYGQMSLNKISIKADYLQLCICGLNSEQAVEKYLKYNTSIPVILHGDWTKKGFSENNIKDRLIHYVEIAEALKKYTSVLAITIHPPFRKKVKFDDFIEMCNEFESQTGVPVYIENRSNKNIWLSDIEEIIKFSSKHLMTIDLPQLFISSSYDSERFFMAIGSLYLPNIKELHIGNVKRLERHTYVARKLHDGEINIAKALDTFRDVEFVTLEILGGVNTFENETSLIKIINRRIKK